MFSGFKIKTTYSYNCRFIWIDNQKTCLSFFMKRALGSRDRYFSIWGGISFFLIGGKNMMKGKIKGGEKEKKINKRKN